MKNPFTAAIAGAAGQVMKGLDNLFTSDDERNQARVTIEQIFNDLSDQVLTHVESQERERSARHKVDMNSDSWLSKNIRPITLLYLMALFTALVFTDSITAVPFDVAPVYVDLLKTLLVAVFSFYFLTRGVEKIAQSIKEMRTTRVEIK